MSVGRPSGLASEWLVLVLPDGTRHALHDAMTIGRGDDASLRIDDRTVSRLHARIVSGPAGLMIEDAGSRYGVMVSGQPLAAPLRLVPGQQIQLGNVVLLVENAAAVRSPDVLGRGGGPLADPPEQRRPNETLLVPVDATALGLRAVAPASEDGTLRPRLRSGWALKRVEGEDGPQPFILRDLRKGAFIRLDAVDAELMQMLDGSRTIAELIAQARNTVGPQGPGRLARLLADFGDRGMLDGVAAAPVHQPEPGLLARIFRSHEKTFDWIPEYFQNAYRHWGRMFFNGLSATLLVLLSLAGLLVFSYLVGKRYGTPLVVAHRVILGGLVFIVGRFLIALVHELAHGLALAHYGRSTPRAGLKLVLIFPYAFVDTSEGYMESRIHRIAISAAGPLCDFSLGAVFSIACAVVPKGNLRDVCFQLAFAAYVGGFFNVNPFLDRDGYHILCEWLREPGLKQRARAQLRARLSGEMTAEQGSPVLLRYAFAGVLWSVIGAGLLAVLSLRYYHELTTLAPRQVVLAGFIVFFALLLIPVLIALGSPLLSRMRYGSVEVNRAVR